MYKNNFKQIAFFFTLFKSYKCNKLHEIAPKRSPKKQILKASNSTKWNLTHDDFICVFSIPVKFEVHFLRLPREIVFGLIADN